MIVTRSWRGGSGVVESSRPLDALAVVERTSDLKIHVGWLVWLVLIARIVLP